MFEYMSDYHKADLDAALKMTLDAGLSTGHADNCTDLVRELIGQINQHPTHFNWQTGPIPDGIRNDLAQLKEYITEAQKEIGSADCNYEQVHSCLRCALIRIKSMQDSLPDDLDD